jgi:hypothetical protein
MEYGLFEHCFKVLSLYLEARILIRIRILIKLKGRIQIRIRIKVISWICVRIRIKVISWILIRIHIYLQMTSQNVWNVSLFELFLGFELLFVS